MATTIEVMGDTIKIDRTFVSGKDRISVNGDVVFEGKAPAGSPQRITVGTREYAVEIKTVSRIPKLVAIHLEVYEQGVVAHSGIYDQSGKLVENEDKFRSVAIQFYGMVGAMVGVGLMLGLNRTGSGVPGGAIGGAIGGGVGGLVGYGIGSLLCGARRE